MPSPEQLKPISVPLQEKELFYNRDHSGRLTREGSIFQRWLHFNHAISNEPIRSSVLEQYSRVMIGDAKDLGIVGQDHTELASQWRSIVQEREERLRAEFSRTLVEPLAPSGVIFESAEVAGA